MRILWFSVTTSLYDCEIQGHNGGGWIAGLELLLRNSSEVELGIAFEHKDEVFKKEKDGVTYYPISSFINRRILDNIKSRFSLSIEEKLLISDCLTVIDDFKPDVIHVFGSEWCFGLLSYYTDIPLVIHMQGSIPAYNNAHYPSNYNILTEYLYNNLNIKANIGCFLNKLKRRQRAKREEKILRGCKYIMGRTEWDFLISKLYNNQNQYYHCEEALRQGFLKTEKVWALKRNRTKLTLITVCSNSLLKGLDVVLKAAKLLKENSNIDFEWRLLGPQNLRMIEQKEHIKALDVNVKPLGIVDEKKVIKEILNADLFVHTSYIDNSPNVICEAQYLGIPVVSTNVGGISSLITHNETGILYGANDPYALASNIIQLFGNKDKMLKLGETGRLKARKRHDSQKIQMSLINIYKNILFK